MSEIKDLYLKLDQGFGKLEERPDIGSYERIAGVFDEFERTLREHIQETTEDRISEIINKLRTDDPMSSEDVEYIKLWVVGDADYYTKLENNFGDWVKELERLRNEIIRINDPQPDLPTCSKLRAILQDGLRLIPDIIFFLEQKERVDHFNQATVKLDREERDLLIKVLNNKLSSKNY